MRAQVRTMPDQFNFAFFGAALILAVGGYLAFRRPVDSAALLFCWNLSLREDLCRGLTRTIGVVSMASALLLAASRRTRRTGAQLGFVVLLTALPADLVM